MLLESSERRKHTGRQGIPLHWFIVQMPKAMSLGPAEAGRQELNPGLAKG